MKELEIIFEKVKTHKSEIITKYNIKEIGIFGSYIRGEERTNSDIDVLVDFSQPIDLFRFLELEEYLSELCNKKVDLVSRKSLKPNIGKQILSEVKYV